MGAPKVVILPANDTIDRLKNLIFASANSDVNTVVAFKWIHSSVRVCRYEYSLLLAGRGEANFEYYTFHRVHKTTEEKKNRTSQIGEFCNRERQEKHILECTCCLNNERQFFIAFNIKIDNVEVYTKKIVRVPTSEWDFLFSLILGSQTEVSGKGSFQSSRNEFRPEFSKGPDRNTDF